MAVPRRKLIEVSIPLEEINEQAAREKSIRHGHPSTLHLWWARRPLAAARTVLFGQLVDDPSSNVEEYERQAVEAGVPSADRGEWVKDRVDGERARLHGIMARLANWDNLKDDALWKQARAEIRTSTGGNPPAIVDPFAGGGAIPLEAQRLGLEAHASDLNPVAVLINRAMIEIPPKFAGRAPVSPNAQGGTLEWKAAEGLAEDVRRYGEWMRDRAKERIGHLYPEATLEDGSKAPVIAWIWARTVTCPNPACGIEMPLVRSWWLGKKKGKEAYIVPTVVDGRVEFSIGHGKENAPTKDNDGTVNRTGANCVACATPADLKYVRSEAKDARMGQVLMATVAQGSRARIYVAPDEVQHEAANVEKPRRTPKGQIPDKAPSFRVQAYGFENYSDLFTNRQLTALTTFTELVGEARQQVLEDALASGMPEGEPLSKGGHDAAAYADAVATYLAFAISKLADRGSSLVTWFIGRESTRNTFSRQALPMSWDFVETNALYRGTGTFDGAVGWTADSIPCAGDLRGSTASVGDAVTCNFNGAVISTDPPYYDNIGYSDLSDFFYVWLRQSLRKIHPDLFGSMLVPKEDELVANPYRHGGRQGAQEFFEDGFSHVFAHARESANDEYPITVYYAFKQSDTDASGKASTGWETLLEGMVRNRWQVTSTWPMRSELSNRMLASGTNALASSIVLSLRPRPEGAGVIDKREFQDELLAELPDKLREMQQGTIAPVDMPQAAIGPGMAIFSKYDRVLESDGSSVTVRQALQLINRILDEVTNEQEGDFEPPTRWCVKWFTQNGFKQAPYGTAETLASAMNTSMNLLARSGAVESGGGRVRLLSPDDLEPGYRPDRDATMTLWELTLQTATTLDRDGVGEAGRLLAQARNRQDAGRIDPAQVKDLAFLVFRVAENRGESGTARIFNALATSWPEVMGAADSHGDAGTAQGMLDLEGEE